ncbi:MAG: type II toxin-antitoxin system VapC family toxin [Thermoplasmata archaeon]
MIFADSSFFVGLTDSRDQWHARAASLLSSLPPDITVSDLIVAESVSIIGARAGGKAAQHLYRYFRDSCEVEYVDRDVLAASMDVHLKFDGRLSVADCTSIVIMSHRRISRVLSFDSDFDRVKGILRLS